MNNVYLRLSIAGALITLGCGTKNPWSPAGVGTSDRSDIYIINRDGTNLNNLTPGSAGGRGPQWSPDGTWISFYSGHTVGNFWAPDAYVVDTLGNKVQAFPVMAESSPGGWFPDGTKLELWGRQSVDAISQAYVAQVEDGLVQPLTIPGFTVTRNILFLDRGGQWASVWGEYGGVNGVFTTTMAGDHVQMLPCFCATVFGTYCAPGQEAFFERIEEWEWSPDGGRIAFVAAKTPFGAPRLYLFHLADSLLHPLPLPKGSGTQTMGPPVRELAWSPDGSQIAFQSNHGGTWELYAMDTSGNNLTSLTIDPEMMEDDPTWSPDGSQIAFTGSTSDGPSRVYLVDASGSGLRVLAAWKFNSYDPAWSPDGQRIAFASDH